MPSIWLIFPLLGISAVGENNQPISFEHGDKRARRGDGWKSGMWRGLGPTGAAEPEPRATGIELASAGARLVLIVSGIGAPG